MPSIILVTVVGIVALLTLGVLAKTLIKYKVPITVIGVYSTVMILVVISCIAVVVPRVPSDNSVKVLKLSSDTKIEVVTRADVWEAKEGLVVFVPGLGFNTISTYDRKEDSFTVIAKIELSEEDKASYLGRLISSKDLKYPVGIITGVSETSNILTISLY